MILHEEAEDGNAMPDLARPVQAVSLAVNNLVKVTSTYALPYKMSGKISKRKEVGIALLILNEDSFESQWHHYYG